MASSSSSSKFKPVMSISSCLAWAMVALLILSPSLTLSVLAQDTPTSVTLTFYNDVGEPIEAATQTIPRALCVNFNTDLFVDGYASVVATEPHAALNLYPGPYCAFLSKSTVGFWNNTDAVLNTLSVRYEGLAPDAAPGTLTDTAFPPNMYVQPRIKDPEGNGRANPADWVRDPEKGKIVIILVAAVLGVGVSIGLYAVYQAAQYKPPPKKKKEKKFKGLQTKKVKKKDAYYLKPIKEANTTAPLLSKMTPPGTPGHPTNKTSKSTEALVSSSKTSSFIPPMSRGSIQERRTQEAPVLIDMQETNLGSKSSSNTISSSRTMTSTYSQNNSPPRRGPGGPGPGPVSATITGVKPSTTTASSSTSPPPHPQSSGNNARTPPNVSAPSTSSPLAPSLNPDLIQFTTPMAQLYQLRPQLQQQQQKPQQQRSSFQPQPYQQYPPPPSLQTHQPRPGFPQLQQRPQRPQIITQYQPPPMNLQSPPTSPTGSGGFGGPRGGMGGRGGFGSPPGRGGYGGGGGGYGQRPPQSYQGQQGRSMSPPARAMSPPTRAMSPPTRAMSPPTRAMSPTGPTSPTHGRGSHEIQAPLQPIQNSNSGYVLPPPSANPGVQQRQYRQQQQRPPRPAENSRSR
ncbi:hypothetical protein BG006_009592 [Podila minutissima]|uniref:Uncharacterized protein n=1 Tax=Podila minutissima TaxID=64525 RepID=A0A9P5VJC6_9FUNG|nr:hypothetical protein BG006_009592 [Podila minutissima]